MKGTRFLLAAALVAVLIPLLARPTWAAVPSNDLITGASPASVGYAEVLDTTEATADADDDQLNQFCGAPATDASVWYAYSQATSDGVVVEVSQSNYSAGVLVGTGVPGSLDLVTCGPRTVSFFALAGQTYYVLAIDDQLDGGGNGGSLDISFSKAPPPPTIEISVDPVGYVGKDGSARLSGSLICTNAQFAGLSGSLSQPVGRFSTIRGFFGLSVHGSECDGTSQQWVARVVPDNGKFAGGKSAAVTFGFACGTSRCASGYAEQHVQLRGEGRARPLDG